MTTVKQLREALAALKPADDGLEVRVWLPGSEIYLSGPSGQPVTPFYHKGMVMIEGNLAPGSALAED